MRILIPILLALICGALFFLPFERSKRDYVPPTKAVTLAGVALDLIRGLTPEQPGKSAAAVACVIALFAVWAPLLLAVEFRAVTPPLSDGGRSLLVAQAILIGLATAATLLLMVMNSVVFGFGASKSTEPTPVFAVILCVMAVSAITSAVAGISPSALAWFHRVLG